TMRALLGYSVKNQRWKSGTKRRSGTMRNMKFILLAAVTAGLAACGDTSPAPQGNAAAPGNDMAAMAPAPVGIAVASLQTADGQPAGTARVTQQEGGLHIS